MKKEAAIIVEDLTVAYDIKPVLWDIDLVIPKGVLMGIVGPNGAGKSTLLKAMLGLVKPISGSIMFFNNSKLKDNLKKVSYVPQKGSVDWDFPTSVLDVVLMGRYGRLGWVKRPRRQDIIAAKKAINKVGMADFMNRQISELSGGQQQRVFLARALVQEADLYLLDEPFQGVDAKTEKKMIAILRQLSDEGKTVIAVHHDLETVPTYFNWTALIFTRIIAYGPTATTFTPENIEKTYKDHHKLIKKETFKC